MMTMPKGKGVAYARVSKDNINQNIESQNKAIQKWLDEHKLSVAEWIEDEGSRDLAHKRTRFQYLLKEVEAKRIKWIIVAERDRFGAADVVEYHSFIHILRTNGCKLFCAADGKELTDRDDKMEPFMATITSGRSQEEQENKAQREHRTKPGYVEEGKPPGGKSPYGYDYVCIDGHGREIWRVVYEPGQHRRIRYFPDGTTERFDGEANFPTHNRKQGEKLRWLISRDAAAVANVRRIFKLFIDGMSYKAIASQLNDEKIPALYKGFWIGTTIAALIKNPVYHLGVPVWNKNAHGRFLELIDGKMVPVKRECGRVKTGRKRAEKDYVMAPPNHANAIIDKATWDAAQQRVARIQSTPKNQHRHRCGELYFSSLVVCGDCGEKMIAWGQQSAYRCATNSHDTRKCRCNRTRHDVLEKLVNRYLEQTDQALYFLYESPEHCREVLLLEQAEAKVMSEYVRRITRLWQEAKREDAKANLMAWTHAKLRDRKNGKGDTEAFAKELTEKEEEMKRLAHRLGLAQDEVVAAVIHARLNELAAEVRALQDKLRPVENRLDSLRDELCVVMEQIRRARDESVTALPLRKREYIRSLISKIWVKHVARKMGGLKASKLVGIEIVPVIGPNRQIEVPESFSQNNRPVPG